MKKTTNPTEPANHIAVFQETTIRRTWHNEEWWFAIIDVVAVLTDSVQPEGYVKDLRRRDQELAKGWGQIATPLRVETAGGAQRVNCANTEGLFRIIQSIPSPKAEPFKRWLAQGGYERGTEIENPELASARARELYQAKGYPQAWIEKRLRSITVRGELTDGALPASQAKSPRAHETLLKTVAATVSHADCERPSPLRRDLKVVSHGQRMGEAALRQLIRDLCGWQALRGEELARLLGKDLKYLRNKHLSAMVQASELVFQYPESPNHQLQAYQLPKAR